MLADQEVQELEILIETLDTFYEAGEDCINPVDGSLVTDVEYEKLKKKLKDIYPESYIFKSVTASKLRHNISKVKHNPPMTSISKAIGSLTERSDIFDTFVEDIKKELGYQTDEGEFLVQAFKRDGVAISLYYEHGKLVRAGLRPRNGVDGEDVTENVKYVEGIPQELWQHDKEGNKIKFMPVSCTIRGELECKKPTFRKIVENWQDPIYQIDSEPKNSRNYTAGAIRQFVNPQITGSRKISFTGYSIINWTSKDLDLNICPFKNEIARAKYSNSILRIPFVRIMPFRYQDLSILEKLAPSLDYEVDGLVISVNSLEDAEQMGTHGGTSTGNPKSKIAWKFAEESVEVKVNSITWNPGRTGKLTPVLNFDPVKIDGTTVRQCTGHNLGFVEGTSKASLGEITTGTKIKIIKSGKIIPKVVEVIQSQFRYNVITSKIPSTCPSCSGLLEVRESDTGKDLICNADFCGVRAVSRLVHFLSTIGIKGIAESIVTRLLEEEYVKYPNEFFSLKASQLVAIGFSKRQSLLICSRLRMHPDPASASDEELAEFVKNADKIKVPAWQLFASLGIPSVGKSAGKSLIDHFGSFEAILCADLDQLMEVEGLGQISAESIVNFFSEYEVIINELLESVIPEGKKIGPLNGKTFVFTGGFDKGKSYWQELVQNQGGTISESVSKNTNYVVVGSDAGSKAEKAKVLNIPSIDINQLQALLN